MEIEGGFDCFQSQSTVNVVSGPKLQSIEMQIIDAHSLNAVMPRMISAVLDEAATPNDDHLEMAGHTQTGALPQPLNPQCTFRRGRVAAH